MNISQAATQSGLPVKTLRYYEEIGLVSPARLEGNDYRDYSTLDVEHLRFLLRARAVGFSLDTCRELLELYRDGSRRSAQVKKLVLEKVGQVESQLQQLQALKNTLVRMAADCPEEDSTGATSNETLVTPKHAPMPFTLVES